MKSSGKGSKSSGKAEGRSDRKSATGMSGSPKKGGCGGKFTWAGDGLAKDEMEFQKGAIDAKDPNYEDPEPEPDQIAKA